MKETINGITILRVLAVLMVLMVHFGQSLSLPDIIHRFIMWGSNGVVLFFVMSGYLIAASLTNNPDRIGFYKKRFIRIVPAYYFVVLCSMFGILMIKKVPSDIFKLGWGRYFLFVQTLLPSNDVELWNNCSALWTMSAFAGFYLLAPFMVSFVNKRNENGAYLLIGTIMLSIIVKRMYLAIPVAEEISNSMNYLAIHSPFAVLYKFTFGIIAYKIVQSKISGGGMRD